MLNSFKVFLALKKFQTFIKPSCLFSTLLTVLFNLSLVGLFLIEFGRRSRCHHLISIFNGTPCLKLPSDDHSLTVEPAG